MLAAISYKVSVFADFSDLKAEPKTVIDFLQEFQDYNMMPAVTDYFQFSNMSMPRFVFSMDQNHKQITIFNERIDVMGMAKEESGFKEKEIAQFIHEASDVIGRILEKDKRKGYRLGIYKEYMLYKLSNAENSAFSKEKFGHIPYYKEADIIEGGSRAVARELIEIQENMKELCNIITTINQVNFERVEDQKRVAMDGFKIDFDLNTYQGNAAARFEKVEIENFCKTMDEKTGVLVKQIVGEYE